VRRDRSCRSWYAHELRVALFALEVANEIEREVALHQGLRELHLLQIEQAIERPAQFKAMRQHGDRVRAAVFFDIEPAKIEQMRNREPCHRAVFVFEVLELCKQCLLFLQLRDGGFGRRRWE
jgi:hypothetical protein